MRLQFRMGSLGKAIAVISILLSWSAGALEFVPSTQAKDLEGRFSQARALTEVEIKKFADRDWRCDMYGMRTRLQVEREVRLYRFAAAGKQWANLGAQMIQNYEVEKSGFIGRKGILSDQVRIVGDNQLVAQLTMNTEVLAYSICHLSSAM